MSTYVFIPASHQGREDSATNVVEGRSLKDAIAKVHSLYCGMIPFLYDHSRTMAHRAAVRRALEQEREYRRLDEIAHQKWIAAQAVIEAERKAAIEEQQRVNSAENAAREARIQAWVDMRKEQEMEAKYRKSKAYASRIRKACSSLDLSRELGRFVLPVDGFYTEANTSVIYG